MILKKIAPTAIIEEGAKIADNVEIGHFCVIGAGVEIGEGTKVHNHVTLAGKTTIGKNNTIFPGAVLGTQPQDLKYAGEQTELIIGDGNLIREFAMFNPGTAGDLGKTIIGNHNLFMAYTHIAHDCVVGDRCILANGATLGGHIHVGNFVNIGGLTPVHQFVHIGDYAMVAGASALSQDIPPFCMAEGNRAIVRGLNRHRLRQIMDRESIDRISSLYKRLFSGSAPLKEIAQAELEKNAGQDSNVEYMCRFILESKRGIPFARNSNE